MLEQSLDRIGRLEHDVRIHDRDDACVAHVDAGVRGRGVARVVLQVPGPEACIVRKLHGAIARAVVHDDDVTAHAAKRARGDLSLQVAL